MRTASEQEIDRFLHTGQRDMLCAAWPGAGLVEQSQSANTALRGALISAVRSRTRHATIPDGLKATDLIDHTRRKVEPMVRGLFPLHERTIVLDVLARSFAYACEALSRIYELADGPRLRRALLAEMETGPMPSDDRVDAGEYIDILQEAVSARNGWKRILQRCAPQPGRSKSRSTAAS